MQTQIDVPHMSINMVGRLEEVPGFIAPLSLSECMIAFSNVTTGLEQRNEINDIWAQLIAKAEASERRIELITTTSLDNIKTNLWWVVEQGTEEDLDILCQIKHDPRYSSKEIKQLLDMAERRITERINAPEYVMQKSEEAYQLNKNEWDEKFQGQFIAVSRGQVVGSAFEEGDLIKLIIEKQKESVPFRAYIIKIGRPVLAGRGPTNKLPARKLNK